MSPKNYFFCLIISICSLSLISCDKHGNIDTEPQKNEKKTVEESKGKFIPIYEDTENDDNVEEEKIWRESKILEQFTEVMNNYIKLPNDIKVIARDCDEPNAFYLSNTISLCYELGVTEREMFENAGETGEELDNEVYKSLVGTLFHEVGHALIDVFSLKITGKEEDVADQLVAYMLTNDEVGEEYLMTVSYAYSLSAQEATSLDDLPFYDTHSLDAQRSVNFLCYVYGSDPKKFQNFVDEGFLHEDRAASCEEEYNKLVEAWDALLTDKVK